MNKKLLALLLVVAMTASLAVVPAAAATRFPDAGGSWAESSINRWADVGIVGGDQNGNILPDEHLNRAAMATILVRLLGLSRKAGINTFSDVKSGDWFADAVLKCAAAKIMQGDGEGRADPTGHITREQAMTMLCRALGVRAKPEHSLTGFTDAYTVSSYAKSYMAALASTGVLKGVGDGSRIAPQEHIDRASALTLLDRLIKVYVTSAGTVKVNDPDGYVVVNTTVAGTVTITGEAAGVLLTNGNTADVQLSNFTADTVKVDCPVAVAIDSETKLGSVEVNAAAKVENKGTVGDIRLNDKNAITSSTSAAEEDPKPSGNGGSSGGSSGGGGGGGVSSTTRTVTFAYTIDGVGVVQESAPYTVGNISGLDANGKARKGANIHFSVIGSSAEYPILEVTSDEADITLSDAGGYSVCSFIMPNKDVTVTINATRTRAVQDVVVSFITDPASYDAVYGEGAYAALGGADIHLPWMHVAYVRNESGDVSVTVTKDGSAVQFGTTDEEGAVVKSDALNFTATTANDKAWVEFHLASQEDTDHVGQNWLDTAEDAVNGSYVVTVKVNRDQAVSKATTYPVSTEPGPGDEVDRTALKAAIADAEAALAQAVESVDGSDVATDKTWITSADKAALEAAINDAKGVDAKADATEAEVDAAKAAVEEAAKAIQAGTMGDAPIVVDKSDLEAKIAEAPTDEDIKSVKTSENNGEEWDSDQLWVTPDVKEALTDALAEAKAVVAKEDATQTEVDAALDVLTAALSDWNPMGGTHVEGHDHDFDSDTNPVIVAATCTTKGSTTYTCQAEGCTDPVATKVVETPIDSSNHDFSVDVPAVDATCAEVGSTAGQKCSRCGTTQGVKEVPATDAHNYENGACIVCGAPDPDYAPDPVEHTITVNIVGNGTATPSVSTAVIGTEVTLNITPDSGYVVDAITSEDVEVTGNTFTMPEKDVIINVTFKAEDPVTPTVTGVSVAVKDNAEATVEAEKTLELVPTVTMSDGSNNYEGTVTWSSNDDAVATVDNDGVVTGVAAGTVTITATAGEVKGTIEITVEASSQPEEPTTKTIQIIKDEGVAIIDVNGGTLNDEGTAITAEADATVTFKLDVTEGYILGDVTGAEPGEDGVYTVNADSVTITATATTTDTGSEEEAAE